MNGIETDRLRIREYTTEDLPSLHTLLSDRETMSFWPKPFDDQQCENWMIHRAIENYPTGFGRFAIELKETGTFIGDAGLLSLEIDGVLENDLGYIIHSRYWGRGFGYEAAEAVMKYGFEQLNLQRICANMPASHTASRKVAEKLGMKLEKQFSNSKNRGILTCLFVKEKVERI
ncbi:GNAT family N-acetyltransferase [Paenibacillus chartarius]|uniref:GNAT family N-acetyltransferase n=1 Tax=Paenibacillus chartarius TaxID=747481 RepID=A0ABV6DK02_9BACL